MLGSETDSPLTTERQGLFKKKKKSSYVSTSTNQSYQFKHQENITSLKKKQPCTSNSRVSSLTARSTALQCLKKQRQLFCTVIVTINKSGQYMKTLTAAHCSQCRSAPVYTKAPDSLMLP